MVQSTSAGVIRYRSRPEAVADELRNAILAGSLKPGDRLVEQKLAAQFGIGQPTVREALKDLELQGFVRKTSKKHTFVTHLTKKDFRDLLVVRLALEGVAVEQAVRNLTPEISGQMEALVNAMEVAAAQFDLATFHEKDLQYHRTIWDLAGNEHLRLALERIVFGLFAFVLVQRADDDGREFRASAEQHRAILEGLRSGDPKVARNMFLENTTRFWREHHGIDVASN